MLTNDEKFVWQHLSRCLQVYVIVDYTCIKWLKYACKHGMFISYTSIMVNIFVYLDDFE